MTGCGVVAEVPAAAPSACPGVADGAEAGVAAAPGNGGADDGAADDGGAEADSAVGSYPPLAGSAAIRGSASVIIRVAVRASGRSAGSRRSRAAITGLSGPAVGASGASSWMMADMVVIALPRRSNGPCPSTAAYKVAPSDHRSEAGEASSPRIRSGAVKPGEPITMPVWVSRGSPWKVAMPKSVSTARSSRPSSTLLGLTSRCMTPAACATSSAPSSWRPTSAARRGASGPVLASTWSSDCAWTSCMTIHGRPPSSATSYTVTTPGWLSRAAVLASRSVRW